MENKPVSFYDKWLRETPTQATVVTSISEYINAIIAINKVFPRNLFRGQANKDWEIVSSAYRCLNKPTVERLRDYHEKLVSEITALRDCEIYEGLEMVAHLQHNGSKTVFIDYTQNPLVALWFACTAKDESEKKADACVYCIQDSYTNKVTNISDKSTVAQLFAKELNNIHKFTPPKINRRIQAQQSVFLIDLTGKIDKYKHTGINIPAENKQSILSELALIGISQKTLFNDFTGFVEWFVYDERENFDSLVSEAGKDLDEARYADAQTKTQKAIQLAEELDLSPSEKTSLYNSLGDALYYQGKYPEASDSYNEALTIYEKVLGTEQPSIAATYNNIALVYDSQGKYEEALKWNNKALNIREKVLGKEHPDTAATYNNIAAVYDVQGEYERALEWINKALNIFEKVLGKENPLTATTYNNIAAVYDKQGKYEDALEYYNKALNIREKVLGKEHPYTATTYNNIAEVYRKQGKYEDALKYYKKSLDIKEKVLGKEHPSTATTYNNIALVYRKQGKFEDALEYYNKALNIREKILGKEHPDTATTYNNIAAVYDKQEKYEDALEYFLRSLRVLKNGLGDEHPNTKIVYDNTQRTYEASGKSEPFEEWLKANL
jgi:Tfp pilus assembly protein PilF